MNSIDLRPFLKARKIHSSVKQNGRECSLTIEIPDFTQNSSSTWGDWGPMVSIEVGPTQAILLSHDDDSKKEQFAIRPDHVGLFSPPLAAVREKFPFYLEFRDAPRQRRFLVYLDHEGDFAHLTVETQHASENLETLLQNPAAQFRVALSKSKSKDTENKQQLT